MAYIKLEDLQNFPIRIDHYDKENGNEHFVFGIETVIEYAEQLPIQDVVEVKHGEWIWKKSYYEADECNCSLCGQLMTTAKNVRMNYCPKCGALMDVSKSEITTDGGNSNG